MFAIMMAVKQRKKSRKMFEKCKLSSYIDSLALFFRYRCSWSARLYPTALSRGCCFVGKRWSSDVPGQIEERGTEIGCRWIASNVQAGKRHQRSLFDLSSDDITDYIIPAKDTWATRSTSSSSSGSSWRASGAFQHIGSPVWWVEEVQAPLEFALGQKGHIEAINVLWSSLRVQIKGTDWHHYKHVFRRCRHFYQCQNMQVPEELEFVLRMAGDLWTGVVV